MYESIWFWKLKYKSFWIWVNLENKFFDRLCQKSESQTSARLSLSDELFSYISNWPVTSQIRQCVHRHTMSAHFHPQCVISAALKVTDRLGTCQGVNPEWHHFGLWLPWSERRKKKKKHTHANTVLWHPTQVWEILQCRGRGDKQTNK